MSTETVLKRTPLFETYKNQGAKVIDFGGWELPVQFSSILEEHEAVRTQADFSMFPIWVKCSLREKMQKTLLIGLLQMT